MGAVLSDGPFRQVLPGAGQGQSRPPARCGRGPGRKDTARRVVSEGQVRRRRAGELLGHGRQYGSRRDPYQEPFLVGGRWAYLKASGADLDDAVHGIGGGIARDEAGADALDRVRAGAAAAEHRRKRGLDGEDLELRPARPQDFAAGR